MSTQNLNQYTEQFDKYVTGPARAFASLAVDHAETVFNAQVEATKAYTDIGLKQFRAALNIREPQELQAYVQDQQQVARELSERVKSDAEKLVSLNQTFIDKARKLSEDNVQSVSKAAEGAVKKAASAK